MKRLNFIICLLLSLSLCFSCKKFFHNDDKPTYGVTIKTVKNISFDTLTVAQLDSVIIADTLPEFNKWSKTYIKDGDTNIPYEYSLLYDYKNGMVYTIKDLRDKQHYIMQKRKTTSVTTTDKK